MAQGLTVATLLLLQIYIPTISTNTNTAPPIDPPYIAILLVEDLRLELEGVCEGGLGAGRGEGEGETLGAVALV